MSDAPLLEVRELASGYGSQLVLHDISLTVREGELAVVLGPNGHGKTTLLRTISGLIRPRRGEVHLDGKRVDGQRANRIVAAGIVHVPQGDLLFPDMTVLENLQMGAHLPAARRAYAERLQMVHDLLPRLAERGHQQARTLSGGERRMVGIGRGLMSGGRVLMLDEPSLGLAPVLIEQIYEVIGRLRDEGITIVLVEENAERITKLADEVHLLDHGHIAWHGPAADLMSRPEVRATYLGG
jgi:branched-chain amino acid transport system ATP-binding protein